MNLEVAWVASVRTYTVCYGNLGVDLMCRRRVVSNTADPRCAVPCCVWKRRHPCTHPLKDIRLCPCMIISTIPPLTPTQRKYLVCRVVSAKHTKPSQLEVTVYRTVAKRTLSQFSSSTIVSENAGHPGHDVRILRLNTTRPRRRSKANISCATPLIECSTNTNRWRVKPLLLTRTYIYRVSGAARPVSVRRIEACYGGGAPASF